MKKTIILSVILALVAGGFIFQSVIAAKAPAASNREANNNNEMTLPCQLLFATLRYQMLWHNDHPNNPYARVDWVKGDSDDTGDGIVDTRDLFFFATHRNIPNWCANQLYWPTQPAN